MSKPHNELGSMLIGAITATGFGAIFLQALGALLLGIIGAIGGYLFTKLVKPRLDKLFDKKKEDKAV